MSELQFRRIEMTDREWAIERLSKSGFRGCEYTFGNNFVWRNIYDIEIADAHGFYFVKFNTGKGVKFAFPTGDGDAIFAVELIKDYCAENGIRLLISANKASAELLGSAFPAAHIEFDRDSSDYIYLAEDLEELKGKKYHAKRNHLNRFYENDWSFEPLCGDNIPECIAMNEQWSSENIEECSDCCYNEQDQSKLDELCIVRCSLKHYNELGYTGGVLRVNGEVQAFTFGEPSCDGETFVVHVEKALRRYQGAYAAVNREFVRSLGGRYKYINREEDTGAENLRKAKLSYYPVFLEEKFNVTFGG